MIIKLDPTGLRKTTWKTFLVRFVFGGAVTAAAGVIGMACGPAVGGLFLAFPSISTASLTLIQRREGTNAAGADALGSALGSLGLLGFGAVVWLLAAHVAGAPALALASGVWCTLSICLWLLFRWIRHHRHAMQAMEVSRVQHGGIYRDASR